VRADSKGKTREFLRRFRPPRISTRGSSTPRSMVEKLAETNCENEIAKYRVIQARQEQ
jgi:hypothetical protein